MKVIIIVIFKFVSVKVRIAHKCKLKGGSELPGAAHALASSRNGSVVMLTGPDVGCY